MSDAALAARSRQPASSRADAAVAADARPVVLVVASLAFSLTNFRYELLAAIAAAGFRVVACAPERDAATVQRLAEIGVGFVAIPLARTAQNPLADLAYLRALVRLVRDLKPVVVIPYTAKPVIWAGIATRLTGRGTLFPLMTGLGHVFGAGDTGGLRARALRVLTVALYRLALRDAPKLFVYNEADAAEIVGRRMVRDPARLVRVAGSGVNLQRFPESAPPPGPVTFLLIARLLRDKGIGEFVEAAAIVKAAVPSARFRLVGPLDPNPSAIGADELRRWTASGTVEYCGATDDVRPFLADCTAFVLPSYYREGVPRTILEALATGRAIITTNLPGCADTVEDGVNGFLVPPRDPAALAATMLTLAQSPDLALAMGRRSRAIAAARYDVHAVNRQLLSAMQLARPAAAGR